MKRSLFPILVVFLITHTDNLLLHNKGGIFHLICSEPNYTIFRGITDPVLQFSADGIGTMDNLTTTTSIVNSGTLSVAGASTMGVVNASSVSLSGSLSVGGNATISGTFNLPGTFSPTNLNLVDSTASAGNITKAGTIFIHNFGTNNTFIGKGAGNLTLTTASGNIGIGPSALSGLTTGSSNIVISASGGPSLTTGSNNIYVGNVGSGANESGVIRLGTIGTHTNTSIAGALFVPNLGTTILSLQALYWDPGTNQVLRGISSKSAKTNIQPISQDAIEMFLQLEPVSYQDIDCTSADSQTVYGFIAEDVNNIMPDLVVYDENKKPSSIGYAMMHALLLKVIQKHHHIMTDQAQAISLLQDEVRSLKNKINAIRSTL